MTDLLHFTLLPLLVWRAAVGLSPAWAQDAPERMSAPIGPAAAFDPEMVMVRTSARSFEDGCPFAIDAAAQRVPGGKPAGTKAHVTTTANEIAVHHLHRNRLTGGLRLGCPQQGDALVAELRVKSLRSDQRVDETGLNRRVAT